MKSKLYIEEIMKILPHRYPFLLIDRVLEMEPKKKVVALKNVTINEQFFQGHFPGHRIMPGVLIIEGMAQALGALLLGETKKDDLPYFTSINNAKLRKAVVPGDQLIFDVEVLKVKGNMIKAKGKAFVEGKVVAEAELMFSIMSIQRNIHPTAIIENGAKIHESVTIGAYSKIGPNVVIDENTEIGSHVIIEGNTQIGKGNKIYHWASIGLVPQDLKFQGEASKTIIGDNNKIREYVTIHRGTCASGQTVIGNNNLLMVYSHVAHDSIIHDYCVLANSATLAGHVEIDDHVTVGGLTPVHQFVKIGTHTMIGGASAVNRDILPFSLARGNMAKAFGVNVTGLKRNGYSQEQINEIKYMHKIIFNENLNLNIAIEKLTKEFGYENEAANTIIDFIKNRSERGLCR